MAIELRPLDEADMEAAWKLDLEAFHGDEVHHEPFLAQSDPERFMGAFEDGALLAMSRSLPMAQFFGGRSVTMGGLSSVAVAPQARGRGLAQQVVSACLADMAARGEVISSLWPATTSLYRGLGWELAGGHSVREVEARVWRALPRPSPGRVRRATPADLPAVIDAYRRYARPVHGCIDRGPRRWWYHEHRFDEYFTYLAVSPGTGELEGYVLYEHTKLGADAAVRVHDRVAFTPEAAAALAWTVGSSSTIAERIVYHGSPEEPWALLLPEQRGVRVTADVRWMTRIVDAVGAVAERGFAPGLELEVPFVLEECSDDPALAPNAGAWRLQVSKGKGRLERAPREAGPVLGIGAFASLYTGWAQCETLARAGLLHGGSEAERGLLEAAFAGPTPWMMEEF